MSTEHVQSLAQREIDRFTEEAERCYTLADRYTTAAEMALRQVTAWACYLEEITDSPAVPQPRVSPERHLSIVKEQV